MANSGRCLDPYSPKYSPLLPKFLPKVAVYFACFKIFRRIRVFIEKVQTKIFASIFGSTLTPRFSLKIVKIEKNKHY